MNQTSVTATNLTKRYGDIVAVDDISFEIQSGSLLAILGPNGAGKTTTVEMLEGYIKPDAGSISILDFDPYYADRKQIQNIGGVLQESQDEPFIKVRELLNQRSRYYENAMDVDELLVLMDLSDKADALIKQLSGGQRRRLEVALAIIGNPKVIFLDEPTVGFDPSARRALWDTIEKLKSDNRAIVLTTHYMDEADFLASEVIVLSKGKIIAKGTPEELRTNYTKNVQVSFSALNRFDLTRLNFEYRQIESKIVITTMEPTKVLNTLTSLAIEAGFEIVGLEVMRPTLEDVFLKLAES